MSAIQHAHKEKEVISSNYRTYQNKDSAKILPFSRPENDEFQKELEIRYGCAFAQWLMDDMKRCGY